MAVVQREIDEQLTILRLDQPETKNALSREMKEELNRLIREFYDDSSARCLLITGTEKAFCAGGDLRNMRGALTAAGARETLEKSHIWMRRLLCGEKPVITAVNGAAAGAGFGLALLGDIIIAADDAYFVAGFSAVGVAADLALTSTLPRAVGVPRAKEILFSNRRVTAKEAVEIGLISRVVPREELMSVAIEMGKRLANGATLGIGLTKTLINQSFELATDAFLAAEISAQVLTFTSADREEGVEAFFARRPPAFRGH